MNLPSWHQAPLIATDITIATDTHSDGEGVNSIVFVYLEAEIYIVIGHPIGFPSKALKVCESTNLKKFIALSANQKANIYHINVFSSRLRNLLMRKRLLNCLELFVQDLCVQLTIDILLLQDQIF